MLDVCLHEAHTIFVLHLFSFAIWAFSRHLKHRHLFVKNKILSQSGVFKNSWQVSRLCLPLHICTDQCLDCCPTPVANEFLPFFHDNYGFLFGVWYLKHFRPSMKSSIIVLTCLERPEQQQKGVQIVSLKLCASGADANWYSSTTFLQAPDK